MTWNGVGSNAGIRGAVVIAGTYQGDATPQFVYDAAVLARLKGTGTFTRVSGSWRTFESDPADRDASVNAGPRCSRP